MFSNTSAVVYDADVDRGLARGVETPWDDARRRKQREMVCWLENASLSTSRSPYDNVLVLQRHLDAAAPGVDLVGAAPFLAGRAARRRLRLGR